VSKYTSPTRAATGEATRAHIRRRPDEGLSCCVRGGLAGPPASHAQSPDALKALADLSSTTRTSGSAITVIGGTRDPKCGLLGALRDGNVYARGKGRRGGRVGGVKSTRATPR